MEDQKVVLCVDDEADILELFKEEFEELGFKVLEASNGEEALSIFQKKQVDCIVSDIRMPGGDGVFLVKNIKALGSEIPIFLVTGFSEYSSEALDGLGVSAVIFKPFNLEEVVHMVKDEIEKTK